MNSDELLRIASTEPSEWAMCANIVRTCKLSSRLQTLVVVVVAAVKLLRKHW